MPSYLELFRQLRDGLDDVLRRPEWKNGYHCVVVPDGELAYTISCPTLPDLVEKLRELYAQRVAVFPYLGQPLLITARTHCLTTADGTFPLAAAAADDQLVAGAVFSGPLEFPKAAPLDLPEPGDPEEEDEEVEQDDDVTSWPISDRS